MRGITVTKTPTTVKCEYKTIFPSAGTYMGQRIYLESTGDEDYDADIGRNFERLLDDVVYGVVVTTNYNSFFCNNKRL
jgi:hypothetical protein